MGLAGLVTRWLDKHIPIDTTPSYSRLDRLDGLTEGATDMIEHTRHMYYTDLVYCPTNHQYETFRVLREDTDPGCEACDGCQELIEVAELSEVSA